MASPNEGNASVQGAADSDAVSTDASTMGPSRSLQQSEAQQLERCKKAVEQCRADLADLRAACKGANAHREKCAELLGAATEAVVALEDIMYDQNVDLRGLRMLQQLSGRVQNAMDQGEAVVKVYGTMSGLMKLASKVCSPGIPLKFADATNELSNLAKQARLVRTQPQAIGTLPGGRMLSGGSTALDGILLSSSAGAQSSQPPGMASLVSGVTMSPASATTPVSGAVSGATQMGADASAAMYMAEHDTSASGAPDSGAQQGSAVAWGDRTVPEEAMQETKIHKGGGKKQMVTAMVHVPAPADRPGHLGHLWYFLAKTFGSSTLMVWDLSARVETEVREGRQGPDMTCMHYDDFNGVIWSGHKNGGIRVWDAMKQETLIRNIFKAFSSPVTAITTDENGYCWAGSDKGRVRCFVLQQELHSSTGVDLGYQVVQRGELLMTDKGVPLPPQGSVERTEQGFVTHPLLREGAHLGPVYSIAAAFGRVWTCGGSPAFVLFKEWFQDGYFHANIGGPVVRLAGLVNDMIFVSPVALARQNQESVQSSVPAAAGNPTSSMLSSFTAAGSTPVASRVVTTKEVEIPMAWQMLTAHNNGMVQVWGVVHDRLTPLLRMGTGAAPILRIFVCESIGALGTAHSDGTLRLWEIAHPRSDGGVGFLLVKDGVWAATAPFASMQISKSGLADAVGGVLGAVTASCSASIKHFPALELRNVAKKAGLKVLGDLATNDPSQWPVMRLSSWEVIQADLEMKQEMEQQYSSEMEAAAPMHVEHDASEMQERLALSGDTNSWLIDWKDLSRSRVIGEGAFGKVWLGRWQETDVAIKQLGSLSALGVQTGSLVHDSSGGIKLDQDVQRALDKEVGLLKNMRHPNIILFMGVVLEPPAVVTEFCSRGSLYDLLKEACEKPTLAKALTWERRIVMALDAAKGMLYLHGHKPQPIIHRDLKSPNLLVEKNWRVKVTDFNLSRQVKTQSEVASVQSVVANNPRWQPPEVIMHQQYDKTTDVYAFGLILWELLTWQMPFPHLSNFQIILAVTQQGQRPAVKDQWAAAEYPGGTFCAYDEYVDLMNRCWAEDPAARPTFEQIIADLRKIAEKVLRESRGLSRAESRAPARAGGAMLLPSQSRNFARYTPHPQLMAPAPPAAAAAAGNGSVHAPAPGTPNMLPGGAAVVAAAAAATQLQPPSPSTVASSAAGGEQYSETGTPPMSATTSGSYMLPGAPSGGSVISSAPPAPSPFDASPASASVVSSNAAIPAGPFGGGPAPWLQQAAPAPAAVSSAGPPPPWAFGDAQAAPAGGQAISSAAPSPPSPFGGVPAAAAAAAAALGGGQTISSAAPPPPSPFGGPVAGPQTISSAAPPPPSPFGGPVAGPQTISSAAPPPPSPFGGVPAIAAAAAGGQTISSAAPPPPSPFGGAAAAPVAPQTVSSAAPPPPSPFGGAAPQTISSAAPPPPSPFGSAAPQTISSAAPPPPSPFGGGSVPAAAAQPVRPLSPYDARLPQDVPEPRHHTHEVPASMPSTVLEASPSVEAGAAAAGGGLPVETIVADAGSQLPLSAAPPAASASGPLPSVDAAAAVNGEASGSGRQGLFGQLRQSLGGSGMRRLTRMQTR